MKMYAGIMIIVIIEMSNENNKILRYNPAEKSVKAPFIIYADLQSLLEK